MQDFTVDIDGGDYWELEAPFTYCVRADDVETAKQKAFEAFLKDQEWDVPGSRVIEVRPDAPAPDAPYAWNDRRAA